MKKYEFTGETKKLGSRILKRIKHVKTGSYGGWIESEDNLSQDGRCFVYEDAHIYGEAHVCENAEVSQDAQVYGRARVCGNAEIYGRAQVCGQAFISGNVRIYGDAQVYGKARVYGNAAVSGTARVYENAHIYGAASVSGNVHIYGKARVFKSAVVNHCAVICGNAKIEAPLDWISVSFGHYLITITKANVVIGCEVYSHKQINKATKKWATTKGFPEEFYKVLVPRIKSLVRCVGVKKA
jgi:UDP-3-O-[3-hydroxymyristoyl] glucosamine N-acyltransferase